VGPKYGIDNHKIIQQTLEVKTQLEQTMVTANNYMFRPLTGHHQVVHPMKRVGGCKIYKLQNR